MAAPLVSVRAADWNVDRAALRAVREQVFVREQAVPIELEWDEFDPLCQHVVAEAAGGPVVLAVHVVGDGAAHGDELRAERR